MYTTGQAGTRHYTFFSLTCEFVGCIAVIILGTVVIQTCVFSVDYPYDRLRKRNKERDNQRIIATFRKEYDKETELRIQRDNELVRRQVVLECHNQQKIQLDEIRKKQKEEMEILQGKLDQKKIELETCKKNYEQDYQDFQNTHLESKENY